MTIRKERSHENVISNHARSSSFDDQRRDRSAHFEHRRRGRGRTRQVARGGRVPTEADAVRDASWVVSCDRQPVGLSIGEVDWQPSIMEVRDEASDAELGERQPVGHRGLGTALSGDCNCNEEENDMLGIAASGRVQRLLPTASLVLAVLTYSMPATAEEQTLKGRLVVTQPTGASTALPSIGGHTFVANKYSGVAVFEDGRVAYKQYIESSDDTDEGGDFKGYSTYTFQNGDSLTMSYTGGWKGNGYTGEYKVLSGTGAYAGASGTGAFKSVDEPWQDASMADVTLKLTLAAR